MTQDNNRCVITGLGMICAIGNNVEECWENTLQSKSGLDHTTTVDTENCYADYAGEVHDDTLDAIPGTEGMDRASKLSIKAVLEAMNDAGLSNFGGSERVSVIMGSCVGGVVSIEKYYTEGKEVKYIEQMPISAIANQVAGYCEAGGVVTNVANACAAGTISIAYAADLIRAGKADVVVAGGADAFASVPYAGFLSLHALDENPCSPFNRSSGINLGEGAGCVIVESYEHAKARQAKMYCEVLGAGVSSDAHHITAPRQDGECQMNAIRTAMRNSGKDAADIDYVNAHGTGTAKNDNAEFLSLHTIFDDVNDGLSISSTKAYTGHCLGAAGAIEAVFTVKALTHNTVPPTLGYTEEDLVNLAEKAGKLDFTPNVPKEKELNTVMSNSFAFGGCNASIIFSKEENTVPATTDAAKIAITGLGVVSPLGNSVEAYLESVKNDEKIEGGSVRSSVSSADYNQLGLKMAFYRKLDNFSQLQAVSGMYAMKDAGFISEDTGYKIPAEIETDIGMIIGSSEGALAPGCDFEMLIAEKGNANGSAFKFPNTVYNAAGGYLSICSGAKGYNVTVTNGAQSGLSSIAYAMNVIRDGQEKAMLATGTDENCDIINELYSKLGHVADSRVLPYSNAENFALSDGSISIMLEDTASAKARDAKIYCHVAGYGMAHKGVRFGSITGSGEALDVAIKNALQDAGMTIDDLDAVIGFANGHAKVDAVELDAYARVFCEKLENVPVISVKERVGEGRAAAAALGCAHGALMLHGDIASEANAYRMKQDNTLEKIAVESKDLKNILVTAYGSGGSYCAIILTK